MSGLSALNKVARRLMDGAFYSKLEETLPTLQKKVTGSQANAMLLKAGVKPDEMKWSGMADHLAEIGDGPTTTDDLLAHYKNNALRPRSTELSEDAYEDATNDPEIRDALYDLKRDEWDSNDHGADSGLYRAAPHPEFNDPESEGFQKHVVHDGDDHGDELYDSEGDALNAADDLNSEAENSAFEDWLSGSRDRDYLDQLPDHLNPDKFKPKFDNGWQTEGGKNYREILLHNPSDNGAEHGGHWDDHHPDVIASLRLKDFKTPDEKRVLLADETQSDWGQAARERGVRLSGQERRELSAKRDDLRRQMESESRAHEQYQRDFPSKYPDEQNVAKLQQLLQSDPEFLARQQNMSRLEVEQQAIGNRMDARGVEDAPFIDNTSKWTDLAIKKSLSEAANGGHDYMAWPQGEQVGDRYNMRHVIDKIVHNKVGGKEYSLEVHKKGGGRDTHTVTEDKLPDFVGRELAQKIVNGEGERPTLLPLSPEAQAIHDMPLEDAKALHKQYEDAAAQASEDMYMAITARQQVEADRLTRGRAGTPTYEDWKHDYIAKGGVEDAAKARRLEAEKALDAFRGHYREAMTGERSSGRYGDATYHDSKYLREALAMSSDEARAARDDVNHPMSSWLSEMNGYNAQRIARDRLGKATLSGNDFEIGGEGHKEFYNNIYPKRLREVMRKAGYGDVQPEMIDLVQGRGVNEPILGYQKINAQADKLKADGLIPMEMSAGEVNDYVQKLRQSTDPQSVDQFNAIRESIQDVPDQYTRKDQTVKVHAIKLPPEVREAIKRSGFPLFMIAAMLGLSVPQLKQSMAEPVTQEYARGGSVDIPTTTSFADNLQEAEAPSNVQVNHDGKGDLGDYSWRVGPLPDGTFGVITEKGEVVRRGYGTADDAIKDMFEDLPAFAGGGRVPFNGGGSAIKGLIKSLVGVAEKPRKIAIPKTVRDYVVSSREMAGDGRKFTGFFGDVTSGKSAKYKPHGIDNYVPEIKLDQDSLDFERVRDAYSGNFDNHINTSIPGFREVQSGVGNALLHSLPDNSDVLDIGSSEGALIKALAAQSNGRIRAHGIDPNPAMIKTFNEMPEAHGASAELAAFGAPEDYGKLAWTEDDGTPIHYFDPRGKKYDAAHEAMVFQFISNRRRAQAEAMKNHLKPSGLAILEEKFGNPKHIFDANEKMKDELFKSRHYTQEQLETKRQEVLNTGGDAVEGMTDLQVSQDEMEKILSDLYGHRAQFWDSGNFKGYVGSDDKYALDDFLGNLTSLDSRFSTIRKPRRF